MEAQALPLYDIVQESVWINSRCSFRDAEGMRVVFFGGIPLYNYDPADRFSERFVIVSLVEDRLARQVEAAIAFGHGVATVRRWQAAFRKSGSAGLDPKPGRRRPRKMGGARDTAVRRMFARGVGNREMGRRLGVSEATIRYTLCRLGLEREKAAEQLPLPGEKEAGTVQCEDGGDEAVEVGEEPEGRADRGCDDGEAEVPGESDEVPSAAGGGARAGEGRAGAEEKASAGSAGSDLPGSMDQDPGDRSVDRAFARAGLLNDAAPLFAAGAGVKWGGVLLAVPLIAAWGIPGVFAQVCGSLGPAFYGLRTVVMTLLFMALLRIKRPQALQESGPWELGRVLGLDRAPEVKTLRYKIGRLARKAAELMRGLAGKWLGDGGGSLGFLYVDGHVREYHGKGKLSKTHVAQRRRAVPGATDTWVNDASGEPVFLVTSEVNAGLTKMLEPVLDEVERVAGKGRPATLVFDRGGWSPKLFARIVERGHHVLTYRKGKCEEVPPKGFHEQEATVDGRKVRYELHEMSVRMGKTKVRDPETDLERPLWMRQVTRLGQDGERQTQVLTTRQDLAAAEVLWRMFDRWRQENFFKYMRQDYALDGLVDYDLRSVDAESDRPNPERKAVEKELRQAKEELRKQEAAFGKALGENEESRRPTVRGFKIANSQTGKAVRAAEARVAELTACRDALPKRVSAGDLERLPTRRKLVTDCIKMVAYRVETALFHMVSGFYARADDEGRKLVVSALKSDADLEIVDGELRVAIAPQYSPHRTEVIATLCERLDAMGAKFPGSNLRLRYRVREHKPLTSSMG